MDPNNNVNNNTGRHNMSPDLQILNDEDIEKMLHPNEAIFPDEIITPSTKEPNSPVSVDGVIDTNALDLDNDEFNKSITYTSKEPITDLVRRTVPIQTQYPTQNNDLYSSQIVRESHPADNLHTTQQNTVPYGNDVQSDTTTSTVSGATAARKYHSHKSRPAFVNKLWSMLMDESNLNLIQWSEDGKSFIVTNREEFVHKILPKYFKHSNFASFVRQLNMYGWHKVQDVKSGSIQNSSDDRWQFDNQYFLKDREDLLIHIVRQKGGTTQVQTGNNINNNGSMGSNSNTAGNNSRPMLHLMNEPSIYNDVSMTKDVSTVLNELEKIKYNQLAISKDLLRINKDNELLWKENLIARERHRTQQQTLEKIFRFLTSMVPHMDQKMIMDGILNYNEGDNNDNCISSSQKSNQTTKRNTNLNNNEANDNVGNGKYNEFFDEMINHDRNSNDYPRNTNYEAQNNNSNMFNDLTNPEPVNVSNTPEIGINERRNDITKNHDYLQRRMTNPRFLLKNRSNSSSSTDIPTISPITLDGRTGGKNSKISEIPFDEDDSINRSELHPVIEEYENSPKEATGTTPKFFNNLQSSIDDQDIRIQHLEDMVKDLSPTKEKFPNKIIPDTENAAATPNSFSLQDYFSSDAMLPTGDGIQHGGLSGLTPLVYDDHTLFNQGNTTNPNPNTIVNDEQYVTPQGNKRHIEELSEKGSPVSELKEKTNQHSSQNPVQVEELSPDVYLNTKCPRL